MSLSLILSIFFLPKANCAFFFIYLLCPQLTSSTSSFSFIMFYNLWKTSILIFFHFSLLLYALIVVIFLPICLAIVELGLNFLLWNQTFAQPSSTFMILIRAFSRFRQINSKFLIVFFQPSCS